MKYDKGASKKKSVIRDWSPEHGVTAGMKRLTIDVPADLHATVKSECARRGIKMADAIRRILETEFRTER